LTKVLGFFPARTEGVGEMNRDSVFLEIFSHVKFPKLAVDLERLEKAVC
jgi:hypothetical protein